MKSPMNSQSESDSVGTLSPQISCRFGVQFSLHIIKEISEYYPQTAPVSLVYTVQRLMQRASGAAAVMMDLSLSFLRSNSSTIGFLTSAKMIGGTIGANETSCMMSAFRNALSSYLRMTTTFPLFLMVAQQIPFWNWHDLQLRAIHPNESSLLHVLRLNASFSWTNTSNKYKKFGPNEPSEDTLLQETPPAAMIPRATIAYSGTFGSTTNTTLPFLKPRDLKALANLLMSLSTSPYGKATKPLQNQKVGKRKNWKSKTYMSKFGMVERGSVWIGPSADIATSCQKEENFGLNSENKIKES
uniref:Uncharacterized protein n=1 Tax=Solanum lycopersicum TaxID=4081 RepID=A0A3Q7FBE4_SOLLC